MKWKKVSPELVEALESAMFGFNAEKRKMFGSPVWFVNGNMLTGAHQDTIFVRAPRDDREVELSEGATPFEPMQGRVMKDYVVVPETAYSDSNELGRWLSRSFEFTSTLPEKEKKKK